MQDNKFSNFTNNPHFLLGVCYGAASTICIGQGHVGLGVIYFFVGSIYVWMIAKAK